MLDMTPVPVAVIGVGHLGYHHARVYAQMPDAELVAVVDIDTARAAQVAEAFGCAGGDRIEPFLDRVEAVSVVVPTAAHTAVAEPCLRAGKHVLVEKPIASTLAEADRLLAAARDAGTTLQIGHLERFNGAVQKLREVLVEPRFIEAHRLAPFNPRGTDVDVVRDLMIHDLDIVLSLIDAPLVSLEAVGVPMLTEFEDVANARLRFANGCIANLTASRVAPESMRKIRFFQAYTYISLDYEAQEMKVYQVPDGPLDFRNLSGAPFRYEHLALDEGEPLQKELQAFLRHVRDRTAPEVSGDHGRAALALALDIVEHMRSTAADVRAGWTGGVHG